MCFSFLCVFLLCVCFGKFLGCFSVYFCVCVCVLYSLCVFTSNEVRWHERLYQNAKRTKCRDLPRPVQAVAQTQVAAESSAAQPTSPVVRTLVVEDGASAKRQRLMAGMPILHETDVDVTVDAYKMDVLSAMPDDHEQWNPA